MTRVHVAVVAIVCGMLFALVVSGCSDGDDGDGGGDGNGDLAGFPDVQGTYTGRATWTQSGCTDPEFNGTATQSWTFTIAQQSGADFSGRGEDPATVIEGQVTRDGEVQSTWTTRSSPLSWQERHIGTLTGDTWTDTFSGRYTVGETCTYRGQPRATRQ